jgi:hypothetical protein
LGLVERRSLVDVLHPVAQHAVDQASQLGGHGLDRNASAMYEFFSIQRASDLHRGADSPAEQISIGEAAPPWFHFELLRNRAIRRLVGS